MPRRMTEEERQEKLENYMISQTNRDFVNMTLIDLSDLAAVQKRLEIIFNKFESMNMKPTLAGVCAGLHITKNTLGRICMDDGTLTGRCADIPYEVRERLRGVVMMLEANWESYMVEGKVNPATGIFLGKNQFGYRDVVEQKVERIEKQDTDYSIEDIRSRYIESGTVEVKEIESHDGIMGDDHNRVEEVTVVRRRRKRT